MATDDVSAGFELVFQCGEGGAECGSAVGSGDFAIIFVRFDVEERIRIDGSFVRW